MIKLTKVSPAHFALEGELTFVTVPKVVQTGKTYIDQHTSITIDLRKVGRCDSAGLALLSTWLKHATTQKKAIRMQHPPQGLSELAKVSGLTYLFE